MNISTFSFKSLTFLIVAFFTIISAKAQPITGTVKGYIFTADNKPADNVTVTLKGTKYGTITNNAGYFELKAPEGAYLLALTHIGVQSKVYNVHIYTGQAVTVPNTIINADVNSLREVSVSGSKVNRFKFKRSEDVAKMPLDNLENPQVYSTIGSDLMQEQSVFTVDDAVKNAPGLQTMWESTNRSGDGSSYYNSRGFVVQSQFRNGIASNISSSVDAINIERIEVIKGPSATLFGSALTSYGGLINRVTKKPYDTVGGNITLTAGGLGYKRIGADINTPLTVKRNLMFRLNTAYTYQEGTQNNYFNKNFAITPTLLYKVNNRLSVQADAEIYTGNGSAKTIFFFPFQSIAPLGINNAQQMGIDFTKSYFDRSLTTKYHSGSYTGTVNYKISDNWTSQTVATINNNYSDGSNPYFYVIGKNTVSRNDQSTSNSRKNITEIQQNFNGDFKIGNLRNRLLAGLDYLHINSNQLYVYTSTAFDTVSLTSSNYNYNNFNRASLDAAYRLNKGGIYPIIFKSDTYSAYVSDVLNLTDQLSALAALRIDNFHNEGNQDYFTGVKSGAYKQTAFSPKFGLVYQPVKDQVAFFANYQNGFTNVNGTTFNGQIFKPQQANQIEGGVKLDIFNGKLSTTLSYYSINVTNVLRADPAHPNFSIQNGTQLSQGFEAEVIANPFTGFNLTGGFAYNDSKFTQADADVQGRRPTTAMSPYSATLWASYRLQSVALKGLGLGFGANYASENHIVNSVSQGIFSLPAYTVFRSSVFYDQKKYRLGVTVNNMFDEHYYIGYTTINPQNLRQLLVSATYRF